MSTSVTLPLHLLVVIDHHEAKIYRAEVKDAVPQKIEPYDPHGYRSHLHSHISGQSNDGKLHHEPKSYYESVAKTLQGADQIIVFGSGTGEGSAMEQLLGNLKSHHPEIAAKIVTSAVVDAHHTTENELLARARKFYSQLNG